jgi:rhodanese-related sulfurtransferase
MSGFTEITSKQLMRLIGTPDAPILLDLRIPEDAEAIPFVIPCAMPVVFRDIANYLPQLTGKKVVTICHKGRKISHGVAAQLRANGIDAEVLTGGMVAWMEAELPAVPRATLPASNLWVTRSRPKVDRIACPWLIRRFVAPQAQFLFVPATDVLEVASRFDAIAFDVPDAPHTHIGPNCTFDALCDTFALRTPALTRLATVIRAADTNTHDQSAQSAGLLALSVGLSRQYKDDNAQLEAGMPLYDAFYRWARDGFEEGHDWEDGAADAP